MVLRYTVSKSGRGYVSTVAAVAGERTCAAAAAGDIFLLRDWRERGTCARRIRAAIYF